MRMRLPLALRTGEEAASISGRQGDEEVEEVAVSCGNLQSSITPEDYTWITQEYDLEVLEPTDLERLHTPLDGYVTLFERYLQFGVRFPLNHSSSRFSSTLGSLSSR